jgi:tetratricopeptide (TPR) repeat protein
VLVELTERGLLFRDEKSSKFDLHPIVRKYCYERLKNKESIHSVLIDYFAYIPVPEKVESLDDLAPVIELYYHTVRAGRYDEAWELYRDKLWGSIYYRFGASRTQTNLLEALFIQPTDELPNLSKEDYQVHAGNELANSYALSGQSRRAIPLLERLAAMLERASDKKNLAIALGNLADDQLIIGELDAAEANLRRSIEICREIENELYEAVGHQELGLLLAYRGEFEKSEKELTSALELFTKEDQVQSQGIVWEYRAIRSLLMSNAEKAFNAAIKARELADVKKVERDVIRAEWLLGAAYLMKGDTIEAEKHLTEALTRDRKINLVELEPDILLEFAKLSFKQNYKKESLEKAEEALQIANRCEYRLKQADIHNFLAEYHINEGDLKKAKEHAEKAKERAECGYKPALEKAEKLLAEIEQRST